MYKSAFKFGLFLMASLIMLSTITAAIPMFFSDAIASEKHSDKNDNFQEYEKNYYSDNDNQYTPDYNYYNEPMKQQESIYDNSNYGYDNNKQISYRDSYEDMKRYSTYPTKDKKYVCQTGQFQGFFVESVEFCKLKIVELVHRPTGSQGPQGPQGIQGPIGPNGTQGPPGIVNAELCPPGTDLENVFVLNGTTAESCDFVENPILDLAVVTVVTLMSQFCLETVMVHLVQRLTFR